MATERRRRVLRQGGRIAAAGIGLLLWCEYAIYFVVLFQCSWPSPTTDTVNKGDGVRALFIADTHLLGPYRGHWFDKLRREWQMYRAFQTAAWIFQPEVIFFLGDLFDEGMWVSDEAFNHYVARFHSLFSVPAHVKIIVVPGNHDMGFHYELAPSLYSRFNQAFNSSSMQLVTLKNVSFVLLNSMAMHDDGCYLCHSAQIRLKNIADKLGCARNPESDTCSKSRVSKLGYSPPILLQHFPMYRESDMVCTDPDGPPQDEKEKPFRPKWDCLSGDSTQLLLAALKPRLILSGHTHHACLVHHDIDGKPVPEYSVPSFSWRNKNDPSFFLGIFTSENYTLSKCFMPEERTVFWTYVLGCSLLVTYLFWVVGNALVRRRRKCD